MLLFKSESSILDYAFTSISCSKFSKVAYAFENRGIKKYNHHVKGAAGMKNKTILFLSPFNHLSMMAEGWAVKLNEPSWKVISAACKNADHDALPVKAMKEVNIDIESKTPHSLKPQLMNEADIVVAIYDFQRDSMPALLDKSDQKVLRWNISNPVHYDHLTDRWAAYQEVCDELAIKIQELQKQLI